MIKKFNLFRNHYEKQNKSPILKNEILLNEILLDENLSYDDTLYVDQDIYYDINDYDYIE